MRINLAKSAGFCFGVKRALRIAFDTAASRKNIYMLGELVHNEAVAEKIKKAGIKNIRELTKGKNRILLIPAHGTSLNTLQKARRLGYKIIDATCPMVQHIHKIAKRMEKKGFRIIIIGDKRHAEVEGIAGQLKTQAIVINRINRPPLKTIKKLKKAAVVVQSTQNLDRTLKIAAFLKTYVKQLKFSNTICQPTRIKQKEIKTIPLKKDMMIIIGSKNSANTKRLYEISKSLNKRTYWVNKKGRLKPDWFKNVKSIGVTAGASTPDFITQEVIEYIKKIRRRV